MTNRRGKEKKSKGWAAAAAGLFALGALFRFAMRGYGFLAYALWGVGLFLLLFGLSGKKGRRWLASLFLLLVGLFSVFEIPVWADRRGNEPAFSQEPLDYIVVPGAGLAGTQPTPNLKWRLEAALELAQKHPEARIICSGGQGADEVIAEGRAMAQWLQERGIEADRLLVEERSVSTRENLLYSRDLIEARSGGTPRTVVVSSEYHMHRIIRLLETLQMEGTTAMPAETKLPLLRVSMFIREAAAVAHEWVLDH